LVLRNAHGARQVATKEIRRQNSEQGTQTSSLHKKLDQIDASIGAMKDSLRGLTTAQHNMDTNSAASGMEKALPNILGRIWVLFSSLHLLIRKLMYAQHSSLRYLLTFSEQ
jgi:hypothetical protein